MKAASSRWRTTVAAKSPFGCSTSGTFPVGMLVAQVGEPVLVAPLALDAAGVGVEQPRLADEIERQFESAMSSSSIGARPDHCDSDAQHQRIVRQRHDVFEQRCRVDSPARLLERSAPGSRHPIRSHALRAFRRSRWRWARTAALSAGSEAVMAPDGTTQIDTASPRRV